MTRAATRKALRDGDSVPVAEFVRTASGFIERGIGLLGRRGLGDGEGLLIPDCRSVHTFGMRFPIDVIFLDADGHVRAVYPDTPSGHVVTARGGRRTHVLEIAAGEVRRAGLRVGDRIELLD